MQVIEHSPRATKLIYRWLIIGAVLVGLMVVIGGITRLTQSGLSMVKWEPIVGALPPLSESDWNHAFDLYKQSPEFHHYNSDFVLSDFKSIFFWEYLHRLIARLIGLVFIIPFTIFWFKRRFTPKLKKQTLIILALGISQGVLGWLMVKSGLVDKPHVSHYRLAAHLITALILITYIYWVALELKYPKRILPKVSLIRYSWIFVLIIFIQITYGAFVAGLKAGKMYNTFPKMGTEWFPQDFSRIYQREGAISLIESGGLVQFMHRVIAFCVIIFLAIIWRRVRKSELNIFQLSSFKILVFSVGVQFTLGVITLLLAVPVSFGVIHQIGAIFVLLASVHFIFSLNYNTIPHVDI